MQTEYSKNVGSFIKDPKGKSTGGKAERLFQLAMTKYEKVSISVCILLLIPY